MEKKNLMLVSGLTLAIIAVVVLLYVATGGKKAVSGPDLSNFATCLADKGVEFYGAFWCPHCQAQKALFGDAVDKLPYVECSTPDGQSEVAYCVDKGVRGYPTWTFADGSRSEGELSLETLSEKSGCPLPSASSSTDPVPAS